MFFYFDFVLFVSKNVTSRRCANKLWGSFNHVVTQTFHILQLQWMIIVSLQKITGFFMRQTNRIQVDNQCDLFNWFQNLHYHTTWHLCDVLGLKQDQAKYSQWDVTEFCFTLWKQMGGLNGSVITLNAVIQGLLKSMFIIHSTGTLGLF